MKQIYNSADELIAQIKDGLKDAKFFMQERWIYNLPTEMLPDFDNTKIYQQGHIFSYNGIKYLCLQNQSNPITSPKNNTSNFRPLQYYMTYDGNIPVVCDWSGEEYLLKGAIRICPDDLREYRVVPDILEETIFTPSLSYSMQMGEWELVEQAAEDESNK